MAKTSTSTNVPKTLTRSLAPQDLNRIKSQLIQLSIKAQIASSQVKKAGAK